ncbi:hypothetical protein HYH02_007314 [Chlamydomonas schloesseri]|uniref:Methyltransferase type 11 domain-containing protein n=1 Tax=Chlamydomonas schloesseri TaxID=2026947 RepID=A0A835WIC1_9CHLO|nr:hypothetical protein HYH02_007314 [Chlamydomonas schloesseri]|eukprot:KAG2447858.1 hypothetical protein HYH02_007314 [Chlamydomonas schloesseri]
MLSATRFLRGASRRAGATPRGDGALLIGGRRRCFAARAAQLDREVVHAEVTETATVTASASASTLGYSYTSASPAPSGSSSPSTSSGHDTTPGVAFMDAQPGGNLNPGPGPSAEPRKVAELDAEKFRLHPSVAFWQDFSSQINTMWAQTEVSMTAPLQTLVERAVAARVLSDPQSTAYWAYHTARMSFFVSQAAAGVVAHHLSETLPTSLSGLAGLVTGGSAASAGSSAGSGGGSGPKETPFTRLSANASKEFGNRAAEAIATFQQDYDNIKSGAYPLPWDMTSPSHRQYNPLNVLGRSAQFIQESVATLRRRVREQPEPLWLEGGKLYPQYYTKTFHFQTDGWFSSWSANVYEFSTEVLFFGRQDAMQRTSLLPIADFVRESGARPADLRLLEVAAGTGRFHTFIKDAYPDMRTVCSDLSPFYLARARNNLRYWRRLRAPGRSLGGVDETGTEFLQTAAEDIAAPDESFDIVVCVYLFHELPEAVRRRAVAEFARVLRPGGLLVLTDSVQLGDRPAWDNTIGLFSNFNEPYYRNYVACDLGAMCQSVGLVPDTKYLCSATKTLSFRKAASGEAPATAPAVDN